MHRSIAEERREGRALVSNFRVVPRRAESSMPLPGKSGANGTADVPSPLIVLAADLARGGEIDAPLESRGYRVQPVLTPEEAKGTLRESQPALLILTEAGSSGDGAWADLRSDLRGMGIPVLDIVEDGHDPDELIDRSTEACD